MAEDTQAVTPQAGASDQPQAGIKDGDDKASTPQAGSEDQAQDASTPTVEKSKYDKAVTEARNLRDRLKKYEQDEEAALPELERTKKALVKVTEERDGLAKKARFADALTLAAKANARKATTVARLLVDAEDMEAELNTLRKDDPDLFNRVSADGGSGKQDDTALGGNNMNAILRRAAGRSN